MLSGVEGRSLQNHLSGVPRPNVDATKARMKIESQIPRAALFAPYLIPHVTLAVIGAASFAHGYQAYEYACIGWVFLTVLDSVMVADDPRWRRLIEVSEDGAAWKWLLYATVPLYFVFLLGGFAVAGDARNVREFALAVAVVGSVGAIFVMPVAHELMHGGRPYDRWTAVVLMGAFSYPHFCIEHTSGHHRNVGTALDPASARQGDGFYTFFPRAISWSLINAWFAEATRLHLRGVAVVGPQNRLLQYLVLLTAIYIAIGLYAGAKGLLFFAAQSVVAFTILEAINYIQHYGLSRARIGANEFEPVRRIHSWDSYHLLSNWCLFNLPQHAKHHALETASRSDADPPDRAPRLPLGYFALLWLALLPPLWRSVMNRRIKKWRLEHEVPASATPQVQSANVGSEQLPRRVQNWGDE